MLRGTKLSDSPVVDGRQKEVFLPPLSNQRKCTGVNDCGSVEDSPDGTARTTQFLGTRWRSKAKKVQNRLEANQSSMSDSFVLPRINGSSQSNTEHLDRKSRASLGFPKRTRDTCIPLSKSCPALIGNPRRGVPRGESPDYDYDDDDFEESDNDIKSVSCNADALNGRKRDGKQVETSNQYEDITEGVVNKLAKLESPRSKTNPYRHHHHHHHHSKMKESDTTLPDIFVPNGLSLRIDRNSDQTQHTTHGSRESKTNQRDVRFQISTEKRTEQDYRVPETDPTGKDNSYDLDCSPWKKSETGDVGEAVTPPAADPTGKQSHLSHQSTKGNKKKRKQKKPRSLDGERPHLLRETTQADIKCMNWLAEGHRETTGNPLPSPAE